MIKELENLEKNELSLMTRKSLENFAWHEKEIISLLKNELAEASQTNKELEGKSQHLQDLLEKFKKIIFGKSSEKSDGAKPKGSSGGGGGGNSNSGRKLPSERYPNVEVVDVEQKMSCLPTCSCCGNIMKDSGLREITEQLTVIPRRFQIHRIHNPKFNCASCYTGLTLFPMPRIKPGSAFSDAMIIDIAASKYADLVPIGRYAEIAEAEGLVGIAPHSLIELTHYLAEFLLPVVEKIKEALLESSVLHADETTHNMLEGDDTSSWYMWGFCDGQNSYFELHNTRSGTVASALLAKSKCLALVSDVYSGYGKAVREANKARPENHQIVNAYCNAHARRKFVEALTASPKEAEFYIEKYKKIYKIEADWKSASPEEKIKARKSLDPHFLEIQAQCEIDLKNISTKSALAVAIAYFTKNYEGLTECTRHIGIPLDNNLQERQLRRPVIGRKTWYGTHSVKGASTAASLFTIAQSCRLCEINVREYLHEVVRRLHAKGPPMTPWEFKVEKFRTAFHGANPQQ